MPILCSLAFRMINLFKYSTNIQKDNKNSASYQNNRKKKQKRRLRIGIFIGIKHNKSTKHSAVFILRHTNITSISLITIKSISLIKS